MFLFLFQFLQVYLEEDCLQDAAVLAALLVYHRVQNRPGNQ